MKRSLLIIGRILPLVLLSAACNGKSAPKEALQQEAGTETAGVEATEAEAENLEIPATITYQGLWMRESLDGSGTRRLEVGERVTIIGGKEPDPSNTDRLYVPIRLADGLEGWVSPVVRDSQHCSGGAYRGGQDLLGSQAEQTDHQYPSNGNESTRGG